MHSLELWTSAKDAPLPPSSASNSGAKKQLLRTRVTISLHVPQTSTLRLHGGGRARLRAREASPGGRWLLVLCLHPRPRTEPGGCPLPRHFASVETVSSLWSLGAECQQLASTGGGGGGRFLACLCLVCGLQVSASQVRVVYNAASPTGPTPRITRST